MELFSGSLRVVLGLLPSMAADPVLARVWSRVLWDVGLPSAGEDDVTLVYPHGMGSELLVSVVGDLLDAGDCECVANALLVGAPLAGVEKVLSRPGLRDRLAAGVFGSRGMDLWWVLACNPQMSPGEVAWWSDRLQLVGPTPARFDQERDEDPGRVTSCCVHLHAVDEDGRLGEEFPYRVGDFTEWDQQMLGLAMSSGSWLEPAAQWGLARTLGPLLVERFGADLEAWSLFFDFAGQGTLGDVLDLVDAVRAE